MLDLDANGPFTVADVDAGSNVHTANIRDYLSRLVKGGFAEVVGTLPSRRGGEDSKTYKLVMRPVEAPRLKRDGTILPEPFNDAMWRVMKMAKVFTVSEIAELASTKARPVNRHTAQRYIVELASPSVGVIARASSGMRGVDAHYRLLKNLGPKAPMLLRCNLVFDPNANEILGEPAALEVTL